MKLMGETLPIQIKSTSTFLTSKKKVSKDFGLYDNKSSLELLNFFNLINL